MNFMPAILLSLGLAGTSRAQFVPEESESAVMPEVPLESFESSLANVPEAFTAPNGGNLPHLENLQALWTSAQQPLMREGLAPRIVAATLDPSFLETHRPTLERLLGKNGLFPIFAARAAVMATRPEGQQLRQQIAPWIPDLHAVVFSLGRSMDGDRRIYHGEVSEIRQEFNVGYTDLQYHQFLHRMARRSGKRSTFRNAETPYFPPEELLRQMAQHGVELQMQLQRPAYLREAERAIPDDFRVARRAGHPLVTQVDFGLVRNEDGSLGDRLVEMQGFPTLFAYMPLMGEAYRESFHLLGLRYLMNGLDLNGYKNLLARAFIGGHDPDEVILLEHNPQKQKTLPDFKATKKFWGIRTVALTDVEQVGNRLFYEDEDGLTHRIRRIYNRVIRGDGIRFPFNPAEVDVEWVTDPDWYFAMSKFSMPFLRHLCVPKTVFLDNVVPGLDRLVLKSLFDYAGSGVDVHPSGRWILQERQNFESVIATPFGPTRPEIRIMYVWLSDWILPRPVITLVRLSRGDKGGVDQNKDSWLGVTIAMFADP